MIYKVDRASRELAPFEVPGASVQVSDPIVGAGGKLSAGFTEYTAASRLEWTFEYDEVFYMVEGALEVQSEGQEPVQYGAGDLGYIEKGTQATIVVPERAYLVHITHPAWRDS